MSVTASVLGFDRKSSYTEADLLAYANREFGTNFPPLPLPPLLMLSRICHITETGDEEHKEGFVIAEYDIKPNNFFFQYHFKDFPVLPGFVGVDGVWQALGFWLAWKGARGIGMAISMDKAKFRGAVLPNAKIVRFELGITHVRLSEKLSRATATAKVLRDGEKIYEIGECAVGITPM